MKFVRIGLSPNNKRQYMLALGRKDIELMVGMADRLSENMPRTPHLKDDARRISLIAKSLHEALEVAEKDGDEYGRVPLDRRQEYKDVLDNENPLLNITKLTITTPDGGKINIMDSGYKKIVSETEDNGTHMILTVEDREPKEVLEEEIFKDRSKLSLTDVQKDELEKLLDEYDYPKIDFFNKEK